VAEPPVDPRRFGIIDNGFGRFAKLIPEAVETGTGSECTATLRISVAVVCGYPQSITSWIISYIRIKFRRKLSSLRMPQKSRNNLINLFRSSKANVVEIDCFEVRIKYIPDFLINAYCTLSIIYECDRNSTVDITYKHRRGSTFPEFDFSEECICCPRVDVLTEVPRDYTITAW
jgi:hypothetical protein